jgi:tetratricopeptide (TPR) repeat protein
MSLPDGLQELVLRFAKMRAVAARAVAENPADLRALFGAGVACRLSGDYVTAEKHFLTASRLQAGNPFLLFELGVVQEYLGRFEEAGKSYRGSLKADPAYFKARLALVMLERQTQDSNMIRELEAQFQGRDEEGWRTLHLGHALSKTWEDMGDHQRSFDWLLRGKRRRREIRPWREAEQAVISETALGTWEAMSTRPGFASEEPIFIVGMPRSGTTLVDRILSSHPDVSSAGELPTFPQLFKLLSGATGKAGLDADTMKAAASRVDPQALGNFYLQSTRPITGHRKRFIDKAPSNYIMAGAILRALPNARVICMRRHPLDTLVGNFKQILTVEDPYYDYAFDIQTTARKLVQFDRTIKGWAAVLPANRFIELSYETLVDNQEAETRRLLAFCGLAWDDRCLNFHENTAGVGTPSARQVRSAIFRTAVGRWEKYGALLDPAKAVLSEAGLV